MKIRNQLRSFVIAIIGLPILTISLIYFWQFFSSSERIFKSGFRKLVEAKALNLTEDDQEIIQNAVRDISKEKQAALIVQNEVTISTIPELKENSFVTENQLWEFIKASSDDYFYQFETPPLGKKSSRVFLLSRQNKNEKENIRHTLSGFIILLTVFIAFCIIVVMVISNSIFASIKMIEQKTQTIADGNLNEPVNLKTNDDEKDNEITAISSSLEKMRLSLKEASERRSRFVMGISHDLRTPIAVIKGYTEAMKDGVMTGEKEISEALDIIETKTDQLEGMVDSLINFEKLSSNEWKVKMEEVHLFLFLLTFAKNSATTGAMYKKKVSFSIDISEDTMVNLNVQLAQRAFENIFNNAIRYTKEGDSIEINAWEDKESAYLKISDTGCGISEADIKNIFELFFRGTNSRTEEGMGIGLSVVKNILDIHGWKINVESKLNEGSAFTITIPLKTD